MDQEKIGKFIKELRKNNNLTQADLALKYGVTYQAVSKWENGKNIPDISIIKQMSKDFNINIDDILEGENKSVIKSKSHKYYIPIIIVLVILLLLLVGLMFFHKEKFEFKTLSASCKDFTISGSIAYNKDKSSIYISNVKYCGGDDNNTYDNIECILYDSHDDVTTKISEYKNEENVTLEEYLHEVEFVIDDYESNCKSYSNNHLYIEILASKNGKTTTYKIPLSLASCNK